MYAIRLGVGLLPGMVVAIALFVLMSKLIDMGDVSLNEDDNIKIADITMPDTKIEAQIDEEKPDKPDEVEEPPPEIQQQEIDLDAPTDALNISTATGGFTPEIGIGSGFARDSDYIPVYVPAPRYPSRAEKTGKTGYAVVEVTITTSGGVRDVKLVEEWPENYGFGREAVKAAAKLKYNPRMVDGVGVEVPGVLYKFTFAGFADDK